MVDFDEYDDESVEKFRHVSREISREIARRQDVENKNAVIPQLDILRDIESAVFRRCMPDPVERQAYEKWAKACRNASSYPEFVGTEAEEFVRHVETMNFLNTKDCDNLIETMDTYEIHIPIGFDDCAFYRLFFYSDLLLRAHPRKDTIAAQSGDSMLGPCFFGVNVTVQPRRPAGPASGRRANLSEASIQTVESADAEADAPGFILFQLGFLDAAEREEGRPSPWKDKEDGGIEWNVDYGWEETGFVLVARLSRSGHIDGIYAIYDMTYEYLCDEEWRPDRASPNEEPVITNTDLWGIPPTGLFRCHHPDRKCRKDQFSCAKLGPSLSSFGKDYRIVWTEKINHPVELVRVKRLGDGHMARVTVDDKVWPSTLGGKSGGEEKSGRGEGGR